MRKIIFLTTFFFSFIINAQYFMYGYNIVPEDEIEHYLQNERELYGKAAEKAFKEGVINGWAIMRRIQGGKSEPNFYWYIGIDDMKKLDDLYEELGWDHIDYLEFAIEGNHITIRNKSREGR